MEKKVKKSALQYARPLKATFELAAFPGRVFAFRKINLDDEAWVEATFGMRIDLFLQGGAERNTSDFCRLWFHFIEDVKGFEPETVKEVDRETGEEKETLVTGYRQFMRKVSGIVELNQIQEAFFATYLAARPIDQMQGMKKKAEEMLKALTEDAPATST